MNGDPYCYPGTEVLRNSLDIREMEELKLVEASLAAIALLALKNAPFSGPTNETRLKSTHRAIFGELYAWAGTYRQGVGRMTKGREAGYQVTYGDSSFVPAEMQRIFRELHTERYLQALDPDIFAQRLAYFYSEMDATHPFREGNSRTLRQFTTDLAFAAGYALDWEPTGRSQQTRIALYTARDKASQLGQRAPLTAIVRENLTRLAT